MDRDASGGSRAGRGVRIALAVSVALNLLVAGLVAGAMLRDGPGGRMLGGLEFGPFSDALTREDRDALRRAFLARAPNMRQMRREMQSDSAALLAALRAEPFDPAALRAVMVRQTDRMGDRLALGRDLLVERLESLTPEARAAFADRLEERLRHGPLMGRGGPGD